MLSDEDVIGNAIRDYFDGDSDVEIIIHSTVSENDVIPVSHLFRELSEFPSLEKEALRHCKGKILDIGAGAGCHTLALQAKGANVKAIDISLKSVEVMKARGVNNVERINIYDLEHEKFDTLLLLMNGLGITGNLDGLDQFFIKAKALLNPGGIILADSTDILYMFIEEDGSALIPVDNYYGEVKYQMEYKDMKTKEFEWLYVDFTILEEHASAHGFTAQLLYEDEDDSYLAKLLLT